ncbi:hypothetical protein AB3S75_029348 [Citrus x aurantiifolia]
MKSGMESSGNCSYCHKR